jgi:hypothetical protein
LDVGSAAASDVTRGALSDWLEEREFAAEAAAVRALAGLRWEALPDMDGWEWLTWPEEAVSPYAMGYVSESHTWRAWPTLEIDEACRIEGTAPTLDDGKAAVVAALIEHRRWCEGE